MGTVSDVRIYNSRIANWWVRTMMKLKRWLTVDGSRGG
jgi:hypothetical protein